ncbi:PREDICTED: cellular nucleic acid-binding protein homolog [Vollenhovia emeryi]|uniref:cellular nucleic acid-binding protein homolog n=1 Tax=Vollenhovia emeryi TaxID=411798 RepID=UPI0005F443B3|nr:PREDICTED: cellular nucleic acid-binding protein homolog [Vollenhovia emeryi]XP_011863244.1 PREDICTED: cellular nucleic acid-binding protein homolog [Vollenhovia emeryi]XP_011863252.1 PREDICTED: cellular nucleic acid-binding protein homolog [Vollenhovia emeryi]
MGKGFSKPQKSGEQTLECIQCGTVHKPNQCPAWGVQCNRCKKLNHFTKNCKFSYIINCTKCGMSHVVIRCPAYGELCTKCGKRNHFASKCQTPFVNNC